MMLLSNFTLRSSGSVGAAPDNPAASWSNRLRL